MNTLTIALLLLNTAGNPVIHIPTDRQVIGADDDSSCARNQPCATTHAEGWVPKNRAGIFAVAPHNASPAVWIQPFAPNARGGNVSTTINLGHGNAGAKEWFDVYLLSCRRDHRLKAEETSFEVIDRVCRRSDPVSVYRNR